MTPSQLDHLRRIDAHLERLLGIAAKRTPGEWKAESSRAYCTDESVTHNVVGPPSDFMYLQELPDATFIASCAGNAEAGWKATRATIAAIAEYSILDENLDTMMNTILATFPLETLNPQKP